MDYMYQMDEVLWLKFTQHKDLKEELLATGDAVLIEVNASFGATNDC
jgi:predicted NAD-dependent protein-ADP-ribosyltransferase YbiA (DUF1768 family)